ncbi:dihydrofolate reductase-like [Bufo gargarizans]|uniref:dihydrofolate reductase-like n=1 Tax=Bufo gargarizans TaxID=30331 RepID=UPI001CF2FE98|nr:dihydrofolate reductase-like [Bufo gargarizans]XP_044129145.1 dihydrofolate reductase-like [Bufo gargarizans]XP_044129146.1 dihydrofolate reductase-like [Bufo gargarizans]XP_044129147.1 dihydrofolate reductase-like [Bufo gargarizans]XP_044129148.1 dihydrofolate reductase-like [Bufo gargarizans]XP_044129149.1 dihydrofolate reductase-like [Bufo gargarizans]XP_044129150.1 dihydrofolate reductase-like [Bufo gargarizans]
MSEGNSQIISKPIKLIAAACNNMGIGWKGNLPWNLPKEFQYLLDTITTVKQPGKKNLIVWGRRSFETFDEKLLPLANTIIVILTRQLSELPKYADYICCDEEEVVNLASSSTLCNEIETIWVLGGVESYSNMMKHPWCNHIYFTHIMADFECDTFFPEFDKNIFKLKEEYPGIPAGIQEEKGVKYIFQVYKKDQPPNSK